MDMIHIENARTPEQFSVMGQIQKDNVCPFCRENLDKYHKRPILKEGKFWIITENQWPYEGAKTQLLAIANRHIELFEEITEEESSELFKLFQLVAKEKNIVGGTFAMRFGSSEKGYASSVKHLHAHLIEPDLEKPDHKGLKFTISHASNRQT